MISISTARFIDYDASKYNYFQPTTCRTVDDVAHAITNNVWSPCVWDGGKRLKKKFIHSDLAAFDFDSGVWTLDDAIDFAANITASWAIIGTTKSHQREKMGLTCDRFRLVLRWSKRILDRNQYEQNVARLARALPADRATVDAGRLFFPCVNIVYSQPGLSIKPLPYTHATATRKTTVLKNRDDVPPWMITELNSGIDPGCRNRTAFRYALHLKDRGLDEARTFDILSSISLPENELKTTIRSAYRYKLHRAGH